MERARNIPWNSSRRSSFTTPPENWHPAPGSAILRLVIAAPPEGVLLSLPAYPKSKILLRPGDGIVTGLEADEVEDGPGNVAEYIWFWSEVSRGISFCCFNCFAGQCYSYPERDADLCLGERTLFAHCVDDCPYRRPDRRPDQARSHLAFHTTNRSWQFSSSESHQ